MPTTRSTKPKKGNQANAAAFKRPTRLHKAETSAMSITGGTTIEAQSIVSGTSNDAIVANGERAVSQMARPKPPNALNDVELPLPPGVNPKHWCGWCSKKFEGERPANARRTHYLCHKGPYVCDLSDCWLSPGHDLKDPSNLKKHKKRHEKRRQVEQRQARLENESKNVSAPHQRARQNNDGAGPVEIQLNAEAEEIVALNQENQEQNEDLQEASEPEDGMTLLDQPDAQNSLARDQDFSLDAVTGYSACQSADSHMFTVSISNEIDAVIKNRGFTPVQPHHPFASSPSRCESVTKYTATALDHSMAPRTLFSGSFVVEICLCTCILTLLVTLGVQYLMTTF